MDAMTEKKENKGENMSKKSGQNKKNFNRCDENNVDCVFEEKSSCDCGCENENCDCKDNKFNYDENFENECCNENCGCENDYYNKSHCDCDEKFEIHEEVCRENEFKETLQRLQAEFDNYRKRSELNSVKFKEDGIIFAINKLLPVLDSFKSAKNLVSDEEFLKSLNLIEKQFIECLNALNVKKIEAENQMFNPNFHNAVMTGKDETKQDGEILEVFQDGYILDTRVIRYSVVKINKLD